MIATEKDQSSPALSWGDVAEASAQQQQKVPDKAPNSNIEFGDMIDHPHLGRCNVLKVGSEYLDIAPTNGRLHKIKRDFIVLTLSSNEKGRRIFEATIIPPAAG